MDHSWVDAYWDYPLCLGLSCLLASALALRMKGWTSVTQISVKEPPYLQSLVARVMNLERGLMRRPSMARGAKGMVFNLEPPIPLWAWYHFCPWSCGTCLGPKTQITLVVLHRWTDWLSIFPCFSIDIKDLIHQDCGNQQLKYYQRQQSTPFILEGAPSETLICSIDSSPSVGCAAPFPPLTQRLDV